MKSIGVWKNPWECGNYARQEEGPGLVCQGYLKSMIFQDDRNMVYSGYGAFVQEDFIRLNLSFFRRARRKRTGATT